MPTRTWPALRVVPPSGAPISNDEEASWPDLLVAAIVDLPVAAIDEQDGATRVFFHDAAARDAASRVLASALPDLELSPIEIDDEDWAARSQAALKAVVVDGLAVAPPWDVPAAGTVTRTIVIQPSMGFGTGHHATTRLCLAALQRVPLAGRSVIDVGTGSGVLAIAASLLGASPVSGIDDDPDAILSAEENLTLNPDARVALRIVDLRASAPEPADVVLANLTGGLLVQAAAQLTGLLTARGTLILSGLLQQEEASVVAAFGTLRLTDRAQEDEWVCLVLQRDASFQ